jgi:hypothetical protein
MANMEEDAMYPGTGENTKESTPANTNLWEDAIARGTSAV